MTDEAKAVPASKKVGIDVAKTGANPPYPFRTGWALLLLALNLLVAAYYFHIIV